MNRHYDNYLCKKYPKLFRDRHASMQVTCMCWGFDIGNGWFNIIDNLCWNIQSHIDASRENRANALKYNRALKRWKENKDDRGLVHYFTVRNGTVMQQALDDTKNGKLKYRPVFEAASQVIVEQVKEKFGTLRFYYIGGDECIGGMVRMAESMTAVTCEVCGNKGKLGGKGWYSTRCKEHRKG